MNLLPFDPLTPYRPRAFVPEKIDLGDWPQIAPLFDLLEARAPGCRTVAQFQHWLLDGGELSAALDEEASLRNIAMTCHTENAEAEKAYLHFVEQIEPRLKPRQFELARIYLQHPLCARLPRKRYFVFHRNARLLVELYRPENVSLETEEARLSQQYQKLSGSLTVQFRGQETTLAQMSRHLEEPDRPLRQEAWELVARGAWKRRKTLRISSNNSSDCASKSPPTPASPITCNTPSAPAGRFDYTPEDCRKFHDAVEKEVMPLVRQLHGDRRRHLGLASLRPWDLAVDPLNRPSLRPFEQVADMVSRTQKTS